MAECIRHVNGENGEPATAHLARPKKARPGSRDAQRTKMVAKQTRFLAAYRNIGVVRYAAQKAGIHVRTHYWWRDQDPDYRGRFQQADEEATQALEHEARRRAMKRSDTLLIFLLKAKRPETYRERFDIQQRTRGEQLLVIRAEDLKHMTTEELKTAIALARKMLRLEGPVDPGHRHPAAVGPPQSNPASVPAHGNCIPPVEIPQ